MTLDELDRLAERIATELRRTAQSSTGVSGERTTWLPPPVRPEPTPRPSAPPVWSGAGQALGDVAPVRHPTSSPYRADAATGAADIRAAAAGSNGARTRPPHRQSNPVVSALPISTRRRRALPIDVTVGVSKRHVHLSDAHWRVLFGSAAISSRRPLLQPGQFAANETISVVGPNGRIDNLRVFGPARGDTQLELSRSDSARLGIEPPLAASGTLEASLGGVSLVGPHGRLELARGVIVAARHLHLSPDHARQWGLRDGDRLDIHCGTGARAVTWHQVLVRSGPAHATEFHLDEDEARAADVATGSVARIVKCSEGVAAARRLVTERDVLALSRRGERIPADALLTPSARDRARTLGLLSE